jgi:hypothetical protein
MAFNCARVASLVMQMQEMFLDSPGLTLTLAEAQERLGVERHVCEAILGALVDASVLARTADGAFVRFFPRRPARLTPVVRYMPTRAAVRWSAGTTRL